MCQRGIARDKNETLVFVVGSSCQEPKVDRTLQDARSLRRHQRDDFALRSLYLADNGGNVVFYVDV